MPRCIASGISKSAVLLIALTALWLTAAGVSCAQYLDNQTQYSNQDPDTETRRSERFRLNFGHYNRDTGTPMTEQLVQGNLQMYEQMWNRWVVEMGLHDINESATTPDGNKYRTNFNFLMTWNDGGGGGAYSSMDANGFFYAMSNSGNCRYDPPSGATPHEMGHVWEGSCAGFNGSNSSGAWWECTANWMQLQFLNTYPQAGGYIYNGMYYPCHGRDYYDSFMIWETAREDPRYGAQWVNSIWTNATPDQQVNEFIIDRMIRLDTSGSADKPGAINNLWGDMAKKMVTWDYERQQWLATANKADDGSDWEFYQRCRTPLVKVPGTTGANWYRPSRGHLPMEFGFNFIPLQATAGTTVSCNFSPHCDPVRQSDWRACLVAVDSAGGASYSNLWNNGTQSMTLSVDQQRLYLVVIATPKPMKIQEPVWQAYLSDAGLQFPYSVSFTNATPRNVIFPAQSRTGMVQHPNGGGWKSTTATVDATAFIGPNAQVLNTAKVRGNARVEDYAVVRHNAQIRDNAVISGHAELKDNAQVYGNAKVRDWARVFGYAEVYENGKIIEHGNCGDGDATTHNRVYGNAIVKGTTYVYNTTTINGSLIMDGDSANGNGTTPSSKGVHFGWSWGADAGRFNGLVDNHFLLARHSFEKDNAVFAMDEFGINHGFLLNGCRTGKDVGTSARGGRVLQLNGVNQAVELHNGVNDLKDSTYSLWFKWSGTAPDQRLWSFGDGASKVMYLTPSAADSGVLRFAITDGTTTHILDGPVIPTDTWKHVAVVFTGTTCTLYVDGNAVATDPAITLFPDSLNAPLMENANFLGRSNAGDYLLGSLDDFRCYMRSLTAGEIAALSNEPPPATITITADTTAPTPNAATWLVAPISDGDSSATMSATPGTDASGWVEYYFTCVSGGGHDSGWVSFNKYTDVGLAPGSAPTYAVKMRDRNGNTTAISASATVTLTTSSAGSPSFSFGPIGIANGQITMTASKFANASGKAEYKFDRTLPSAASSGWKSSPTWTQNGLITGTSYTYTVSIRDGRGNTSGPSAPVTAIARDDTGPALPITVAHWQMLPYATIDNKVSMTAQAVSDPSGVEYQFHCISGGGPDSAWQASPTYVTPALADGTYVYQYKVRDKSARNNESAYSSSYPARITQTTGYHSYTLEQVLTGTDDWLVSFPATVMKVNTDHYMVKNLASGSTIKVTPNTYALATEPSLALKNVTIKGHLYTLGGSRVVTYSTLTSTGNPALYTISGKVTNAAGIGIAGATLCFSDTPNASIHPIITTTTDASGNFSKGVTIGAWYVAVTSNSYNTSSDQLVTVNATNVSGVNFTVIANASVTGTIVSSADNTPLAGASVYFSRSPGPSGAPVFTATSDSNGNYSQPVQDGVWYVAAGAIGYYPSADKMISVNGSAVGGISFALRSSVRNTPQAFDLLFSSVTDSLPTSGASGSWPTYLPAGQSLSIIGSPTMLIADGVKWVSHLYADGDGFLQSTSASAIPINGATIVVAAKPQRNNTGTSWTSIVDIFYNRLVLGIRNNTGRIDVWRNGVLNSSASAIPDGQATILTLVVQPTGQYKVFANGVEVMNVTSTSDMTSLVPNVAGPYANAINIGRNNPDGWTSFNGGIGDVFVYKTALSNAARQQLEADMTTKFIPTDHTLTATTSVGGTINPSGAVPVVPSGSQSFTISPLSGYLISQVTVDGVPQGAVASYTFSNVAANHTIHATFTTADNTPPTISTIAAQTIPADTSTVALGFTVSDTQTSASELTLTGSSSNPALVPASNIVFGGSGANRTVTVTPTPSMSGSATITLTVSDGALTSSGTFILSVIPLPAAKTITFQAGDGKLTESQYADSWISQGTPTGTYGTDPTLFLRTSTTNQNIALVAFFGIFGSDANQIPTGSIIQNATLRMANANDRGKQNDIHLVDREWAESGVTWSSYFAGGSSYGSKLTTIGNSSGISANGTYTIDIKSAVQTWANDPASNLGLLFRSNGIGTNSDPQQWASGENATAANRPLLTVSYVPPNQAPVITAAATTTPIVVTGTTNAITVTATDDGGGSDLTYTWSLLSDPPEQPVIFSTNGNNAAQSTTVTFGGAGSYLLLVTVTDAFGLTATSSVSVTVIRTTPTVSVSNSPVIYSGLPLAAIVTGSVPGIVSNVKYNNAPTIPLAVGTYAVTADFTPADTIHFSTLTDAPAGDFVIRQPLYDDWQRLHFTPEQIVAGEATEVADPDHDQLANLAEYALGTDPHAFTQPPPVARTGAGLIITFQRPRGLADVAYTVESSDDLIAWTVLPLELFNDGPMQTMQATDPLISGDPTRRMIRLRFTKL